MVLDRTNLKFRTNSIINLTNSVWNGKSVSHFSIGSGVEEIVNMVAVAVVDEQEKDKRKGMVSK